MAPRLCEGIAQNASRSLKQLFTKRGPFCNPHTYIWLPSEMNNYVFEEDTQCLVQGLSNFKEFMQFWTTNLYVGHFDLKVFVNCCRVFQSFASSVWVSRLWCVYSCLVILATSAKSPTPQIGRHRLSPTHGMHTYPGYSSYRKGCLWLNLIGCHVSHFHSCSQHA